MYNYSVIESSWSCDTEGSYDEFVYHFMVAVNMKTPDDTLVTWHDVTTDGYISMREAFLLIFSEGTAESIKCLIATSSGSVMVVRFVLLFHLISSSA